jgi:purine-binding chemotaxis protein CheW
MAQEHGATAEGWDRDEILRQIVRALGVEGLNGQNGQAGESSDELLASSTSDGWKGGSVSEEKMQATLLERARALAKSSDVETSEGMPLVVFSLANETYGIATDYVRDVQPLRQVTPVPCTPSFVVGVINIRGSIYSVIDIRSFFGVSQQEITAATKVIVVDTAELQVGILADDVSGAMSVPRDEINPPLAAQATIKEEYIEGVTNDMLIILNLEALMQDERIVIHEEVG